MALTEVEKLRVSLARVAQAHGLPLAAIPGSPKSWFYGDLVQAAKVDRGWNSLAAKVVEYIEYAKEAANG